MDGKSRAMPIEKNQHSLKEECFVKQEAKNSTNSIGEHPKSRKRSIRDISAGFTKAVIICNSSELSKSESNTYRPNNIVIELVKKNPLRYGKVTFQKFTSEREIREELSLRFPILKNRKFWFASADQYGKLNFRELEEWSGRNLRRWLPGSSAMYIILDTSRVDDESEARTAPEHCATNVTNSFPYSGITCTTVVRVGASTTGPVSWRANNSQRALLDFLSSPEKSKLCDTKKIKMFAIDANEQKLDHAHSQSSKSPARLDLRSMALYTKNERIHTDLASGVSRKQDYFSSNDSLLDESTISPKPKRMFNISGKTFLRDASVDLEQQALKIKKEPLDFDKISYETADKPCSSGICKNTQKNAKSSSQEPFTSNDNDLRARTISNDCVECIDEKTADSTPSSSREGPHRRHLEGSRIPPYLSPYFMVNPRALYGPNPPLGEQVEKENENKVLNENEILSTSHSEFSPPAMQAIYVPSTGFFPWGQYQSGLMRLPDKGPSLAFVPFEFLPYATNGRLFQYGNNSANTYMNQSLRDLANLNVVHQNTPKNSALEGKEGKWDERPKEKSSFACTGVSIETHPVEPDFTTKIKDKDVVQKFLDKTGTDEREGEEDQSLSYNCEMFPCSGPCKGGESFVVVLSQPLEDQFNQASFCATFDDTSVIELTPVDHFTLRGKSIPESRKSGNVTVRIEANDHLIGHSSYTYEESFIDGLKNAILSGGKHGESLLQFMTSSEKERNKMQEELTDWLELVLYLSAQKGVTHVIDTILGSIYGDAVKTQCSKRTIQPYQVARRNNHEELSQYLQNKLNRNDLENKKSIKIEKLDEDVEAAAHKDFEHKTPFLSLSEEKASPHAQDRYDESRDIDQEEIGCQLDTSADYEGKADNLLLLSSIASRMETTASTASVSSTLEEISNGTTKSRGKNTLKKETDSDRNNNRSEPFCSHGGFLKKVFVLPPNSLYLPSQSELCKLRGSGSSYCKVYFTAEMSEDDVYDQIRSAFDDLVESSFRLAVVDQTGKLVFYDGFWTGKVIRRKLRGNSVLYVVPVNENEDQEDG